MRGLTETALDEGLRGLTKRPLNNNRISNNTSCSRHDSAEVIVVDGGGRTRMDVPKGSKDATLWYIDGGPAASGVRGNRRGVPGIDGLSARLAHQPCLEAMPAVVLEDQGRPVLAR